jgi:hypothetical protein
LVFLHRLRYRPAVHNTIHWLTAGVPQVRLCRYQPLRDSTTIRLVSNDYRTLSTDLTTAFEKYPETASTSTRKPSRRKSITFTSNSSQPSTRSTSGWVTSDNRGLGRSEALALADSGFDLILTYRSNEQEAVDVVAAIEGRGRVAVGLPLDATQVATFEEFAAQVRAALSKRRAANSSTFWSTTPARSPGRRWARPGWTTYGRWLTCTSSPWCS